MRSTRLHAPTLRSDPADAVAPSHRLLVRAGFVRRPEPGRLALLPLAVRVRTKVIQIIREELEAIGAQELAAHPDDLAALAAELGSYRRLPQTWFRLADETGEPRPRSGLLKPREYTVADSRTLDLDRGSADHHLQAYKRIFDRLGIPATQVENGPGTAFVCEAPAGEDRTLTCPEGDYAAIAETAAARIQETPDGEGPKAPEPFDTPGVRTIEDLATKHGIAADRQIKTLVYVLDERLTLVLLRGDHALSERKLLDAAAASHARPASPEEIVEALGATPGSLGAVGVTGLPVLADEAVRGRRDMTTGANRDGVHLRGVDLGRDVAVASWADLRQVGPGEPCPRCAAPLESTPAILLARVGTPEPMGVTVLDAAGAGTELRMGRHTLRVEQAIAAIVERHHDDRGIVWPVAVAPFEVVVVLLNPGDAQVTTVAEDLAARLFADGLDVLLDDRDERPGAKFKDAELIGVPYRVTIGRRGLDAGTAELTTRQTGETAVLPLADVADHLGSRLSRE